MQIQKRETIQGPAPAFPSTVEVRRIVDDAIGRYFDARRANVGGFVKRHYSLIGSARLHRHALGWDVVKAPANVTLIGPAVALKLAALGAGRVRAQRAASWLGSRDVFIETGVGRQVEWLVQTELLELPYTQNGRTSTRDALAGEILADARIESAFAESLKAMSGQAARVEFRARLETALAAYTSTRAAAADLTNALIGASVGTISLKKVTPSALSLGPPIAAAIAQHSAVASFPLGAGIGGLWYGAFPASASAGLVVGATAGVMGAASVLTAFTGILTDPAQRHLGLHQRRLYRMVDVLERQFLGDDKARYVVRDHYVTRIFDLLEVLRTVYRVAH